MASALSTPVSATLPAQRYETCVAQAGGVTVQLKECDDAEMGRRDALLSQLFQNVLAAVDPERQEGLRTAERAWAAFMEADCRFRMSAEAGGTNAPLLYYDCRLELTARRIADLQQALKIATFFERHGRDTSRSP